MHKQHNLLFPRPEERRQAELIDRLIVCNPFNEQRIELERALLGEGFVPVQRAWNLRTTLDGDRPNLPLLQQRVQSLLERAYRRLVRLPSVRPDELRLYESVLMYHVYYKLRPRMLALVVDSAGSHHSSRTPSMASLYQQLCRDIEHYAPSRSAAAALALPRHAPHVFALFFQLLRGFVHIYTYIIGSSAPIAELRASVWQSIFTHDLFAYRRSLYTRMGDLPTLILGPSGTGKELVARAIAWSRYIPWDEHKQAFAHEFRDAFVPVNLSALSPTLIESEVFGHRRGAFTGALDNHHGWLETCPPHGAVFLDEIGELDAGIQVKLLRTLQERTFQRLGETKTLRFQGKLLAATHKNLASEVHSGRFRSDFYYRLCADVIETPSLAAQLAESPDDLRHLVRFVAHRIAPAEAAERLACEVSAWVETHLGAHYAWPGNFRELEQCARNVLIRGRYQPLAHPFSEIHTIRETGPIDQAHRLRAWIERANASELTADELLAHYCAQVYAETGSLNEAARRLGLDPRTVKAHVRAV